MFITANLISLKGLWKISHTVIALAMRAVIAFMVSVNMNAPISPLKPRKMENKQEPSKCKYAYKPLFAYRCRLSASGSQCKVEARGCKCSNYEIKEVKDGK